MDDRNLTPPYARFLVRLIRPFPNFDFFFVKSLRQRAVQLLQLRPGDRVLDAGCGPGGSFPYLVDAVGHSGEVVGVEISPETATNASRRIAKNGWSHVQVVVADAQQVTLQGKFDGLLMFAAPDVYASPLALANILPCLKKNSRVVIFGAKLSRRRLGGMFNPLLRSAFSNLTFASTPRLNYEPWALLKNHVDEITVQEYFFGWMFLAWGSINADHQG
jgi:demethylmenaquinone methyltransferase/2-methoxy-6-polyprenyl-1,4-benzoquinol methylase